MINYLATFLTSFFHELFKALAGRGQSKKAVDDAQFEEFMGAAIEAIKDAIDSGELEMFDDGRVLSPFEYHLERTVDGANVTTRSELIEGIGAALDSVGEEITHIIPEATFSSRVERAERGGRELIDGYLTVDVDKHTPVLYSIYMDLLKDGFVFRTDSKAFVITANLLTK